MSEVEDARLSVIETRLVRDELERILASTYFHGSQRCSKFLQYSVEHVLSGYDPKELKERIIGIEAFRRDSDYDTTQDNTVRVTANEIRKRLAQYYSKTITDGPIFELPAGSYAVVFHWKATVDPTTHEADAEVSVPAPQLPTIAQTVRSGMNFWRERRRTRDVLAATILSLAVVGAIFYAAVHRAQDVATEVWAPLLNSRKPITICVAEPVMYHPKSGKDELTGPDDQMVKLPNAAVGVGDAYALADIAGFLGSRHPSWHVLPSSNTLFRELTTGPVILIGSFSNPWANRLLGSLRFVFVPGQPDRIIDRAHPEKDWTIQVSPQWTAVEDYALISRFKSPETDEIIVSLAGATNFGTEAAGRFLTNSDMLAAGMSGAPRNWQSKNFQLLLHVKIQDSAPEPPTIVASYFW